MSNLPAAAGAQQSPVQTRRETPPKSSVTAEFYTGTIPHPDHLEQVEALLPGATGRMIGMAEAQASHRFDMERMFIKFNGWSQILGTVFAGLFLLSSVGGGVYLLATGKSVEGFTTLVIGTVAVALAFLRVRKTQGNELAGKQYGKPESTGVTKR